MASDTAGQMLHYRPATLEDAPALAQLNRQLIIDEGHSNPMTLSELETRMRGWLAGAYEAALFEQEGSVVAYVLYRYEPASIYVRHLFVVRHRRRQGLATQALRYLAREVWPAGSLLSIDVLAGNHAARAFYERLGFEPYALTLQIDGSVLARERDSSHL